MKYYILSFSFTLFQWSCNCRGMKIYQRALYMYYEPVASQTTRCLQDEKWFVYLRYIYLRCTLYGCIFLTTYIKYHQNHFFQSHSNYFLTSIAITWHSNQCQKQHVLLRMSLGVCDLECMKPLVWSIFFYKFLLIYVLII